MLRTRDVAVLRRSGLMMDRMGRKSPEASHVLRFILKEDIGFHRSANLHFDDGNDRHDLIVDLIASAGPEQDRV
jgi:hypothetical protein